MIVESNSSGFMMKFRMGLRYMVAVLIDHSDLTVFFFIWNMYEITVLNNIRILFYIIYDNIM